MDIGEVEMASIPKAQLERAAPHEILKAVERLVVSNSRNADVGWTFEEIKVSLMERHTDQWPPDLDDMLLAELNRLLDMGDLKVVVGVDGQQTKHYTLSPPYLPRWFGPDAVVKAVEVLDEVKSNTGGSTWSEIKKFLKVKHQPKKPLPRRFDTVLRTMLSVVHKRGHLAIARGSGGNGPRHYTRRQAPALAPAPALDEPDPIHIPAYVWWYLLGQKLSAGGGGLDDEDEDGDGDGDAKIKDEDALLKLANNTFAATRWFGPRTVLQEIERLEANRSVLGDPYANGWTCHEIRDSLMGTHRQKQQDLLLTRGFDNALEAMLLTLSKGGYLTTDVGDSLQLRYKLSITPPFFPSWFRPEAVLQAVKELDDDSYIDFDGGWTWRDIKGRLMKAYGHSRRPQLQWEFDAALRTMLSGLRLRGHLTWGASGSGGDKRRYTHRHAPVKTAILDNNLLWYYVGYNLRRHYGLDDDAEFDEPGHDVVGGGLRRRPGTDDILANDQENDTKPLPDDDEDKRKEKSHGALYKCLFGWWPGIDALAKKVFKESPGAPSDDIESLLVPMTIKKRKQQRRKLYMIWSMFVSFCGHAIVLGLSLIPVLGEETSNKWLKWGVMNLLVSLLLLAAMIVVQISFLDLEDTSPDEDHEAMSPDEDHVKAVKWNKLVNLSVVSCSKIVYVLIKEAPGPTVALRITAHVVDFLIDVGGAIYLCRNLSCLDQEMTDD